MRKSLLETRHSRMLAEFCRISTQAGVELARWTFYLAGEDYYAAMRRSVQRRWRELPPWLVGEDDADMSRFLEAHCDGKEREIAVRAAVSIPVLLTGGKENSE